MGGKGYKWTEEQKAKLRGRKAWNKGLRGLPARHTTPHSEEAKKKIREARARQKITVEHRKAISQGLKGRTFSEEHRKKLSEANKGKHQEWLGRKHRPESIEKISGANCHLWRGGLTTTNKQIRMSRRYREWRKVILARDGRCVFCGSTRSLEVDHIKSFADFPELRFVESNGRVLCRTCHKTTPNYGFRGREYHRVATEVQDENGNR